MVKGARRRAVTAVKYIDGGKGDRRRASATG
jgi:hypothetical protein